MEEKVNRFLLLTAILTASLLLLGGCGVNRQKSGYTITVKVSVDSFSGGVRTTDKQELEWNPIKRELTRVSDELNDFKTANQVENAGYRVVSGDFVTGPTYVRFKNSTDYIFEPSMDDVTKGYVSIYIPAANTSYSGEYSLSKYDFPSESSPFVSVINDSSPLSGQTIGLLNYTEQDGKYRFSPFLSGAFQAFSIFNNREDITEKIDFEAVNLSREADIAQVKAAIDDMVKEKKVVAILSALSDSSGEIATYAANLNIPFYEISYTLDKQSQGKSHFLLPSPFLMEATGVAFTVNELTPSQIVVYDGYGTWEELVDNVIHKYENQSTNTQSIELKYLPPDQVKYGNSYRVGEDAQRILSIDRRTSGAVIAFDTIYYEGQSFFSTLFNYTNNPIVPVVLASGLWNEKIPDWWKDKNPLYSISYFDVDSINNPIMEYVNKYKDFFRRYPNRGELIGYETGNMLIKIITGSKNIGPDQIIEATATGSFNSATGEFGFGEDNTSNRSYAVYKYDKKNGKVLYGLFSPIGELIK